MDLTTIPSTDLSAPFWRGLQEGRLCLQLCARCDSRVFYPRERCPHCFGPLEWSEHPGVGTLTSTTVIHLSATYAAWTPYVLGIVDLDGARLFSVIVSDGSPRIGDEVRFHPDVDALPEVRGMPTPFVFNHISRRPGPVPGDDQ